MVIFNMQFLKIYILYCKYTDKHRLFSVSFTKADTDFGPLFFFKKKGTP